MCAAVALASECPATRRTQLLALNFGTGYAASSAGQKSKRADGEAIADHISDIVDGDAVKHLEVLEFMVSKFKTNNPSVVPDKHVLLGLEVMRCFAPFIVHVLVLVPFLLRSLPSNPFTTSPPSPRQY